MRAKQKITYFSGPEVGFFHGFGEKMYWKYDTEGLLCEMPFLMTNKHALCFNEYQVHLVFIETWP